MDKINFNALLLVRMRVIDERTERSGRVIVNCGEEMVRFGTLEHRFGCGNCGTVLVIGARPVVGKVLYRCSCRALNEVEGVPVGRAPDLKDRRNFRL